MGGRSSLAHWGGGLASSTVRSWLSGRSDCFGLSGTGSALEETSEGDVLKERIDRNALVIIRGAGPGDPQNSPG